MLTLRAVFNNGGVAFLEEVPFSGRHEILVTFLADEEGVPLISRKQAREAVEEMKNAELTRRELEILQMVQQGATNEEIAGRLEISHGTARNHLSSIYGKLKVKSRTQALHKAVELGLISPPKGPLG